MSPTQLIFTPIAGAGSGIAWPTYRFYKDGATWYVIDEDGATFTSNANPLTALNAGIAQLSTDGGGAILVKYQGATITINGSITMKSNVAVWLEHGVSFTEATNGQKILDFGGTSGAHLVNAHVLALGKASIIGNNSASETGITFSYADRCSVSDIEVKETGYYGIYASACDRLEIIRPYVHDWAKNAGQTSAGILLSTMTKCSILDPWVNGTGATNITGGILMTGACSYTDILDALIENIGVSHGIYISNDASAITNCKFSGTSYNCNGAGLKLSAIQDCNVDWNSRLCGTGITADNNGVTNLENNDIHLTAKECTYGLSVGSAAFDTHIQGNRFSLVSRGNATALATGPGANDGYHVQSNTYIVDSVGDTNNVLRINGGTVASELKNNIFKVNSDGSTNFGIYWVTTTVYGRNNKFIGQIRGAVSNSFFDGIGEGCVFPNYFNSIVVPFVDGTTPLDGGFEIDGTDHYARAFVHLPDTLREVLAIKIYARSVVAEVHEMELDISANGGADNEPYNTEAIAVAANDSVSVNFAADDVIYWQLTEIDDADISHLSAGDNLEIKVLGAAAAGDNCATDALFRTVEIVYL